MKKFFTLLLFAGISFSLSAAQYYVAGNGGTGNPWCDGKNWNPSGSQMTMNGSVGEITFSSVPAGNYQFKVTTGSWTTNWGFSSYDQAQSNLYATGNGDNNVCFLTQQPQDITITFDGSKIVLHGSVGNLYPDTTQYGKYGVPSEYEGVMLQAFYWDSYRLTKYSRTKYIDWLNEGYASEVARTFDLVWFPPCGNGGGVGYYTKTYSNLDSDWGSKAKLLQVLDTLHAHGCKALADVVVNHRASSSGWAKSFTSENFGEYGTFQITSQHICSTDEAATSSSSDSRSLTYGAADTGDNDAGCRDLDHTSAYVQDYIKAYAQWLLHSVGFDGFRYDMVKGYSGMYLSLYNQTSDPFFSVAEYWDGLDAILAYLSNASYNTTAFDFPLKFKLNDWRGGSNYSILKNAGMRSKGKSKYAVTFIDNHDTFERSDNQGSEFMGYNVDILSKQDAILQANAYILMMPGTPCVFWPHWYTFHEQIKPMIAVRKLAGVHSESAVLSESASSNSYEAMVQGHHGCIVLRMGSSRDKVAPAGYTAVVSGNLYDIYVETRLTALETVSADSRSVEKRIENGQLVIVVDGVRYTNLGTRL